MKPHSRALALLVAASLAGCAPGPFKQSSAALQCTDDESLVIRSFQRVDSMSMCRADATNMNTISYGVLDVGFLDDLVAHGVDATLYGYWLPVVVQNNLIDVSTTTTGQRNTIQLAGFNAKISASPNSGPAPLGIDPTAFFVSSAGGTIDPAGGKAAMFGQVLPAATALAIYHANKSMDPAAVFQTITVLVNLQPVGTHAGSPIYGACSQFPIRLCEHCLTSLEVCQAGGYSTSQIVAGGCRDGQDDPVGCCTQTTTGGPVLCGANLPKATM